ncbi:MAG TPA: chemotaxis protein CheB [Mucilaginibacter sp.]|nr:chemotaxis protein CheB [Mucilaginibacter sp.]
MRTAKNTGMSKTTPADSEKKSAIKKSDFYVIGIGASAGGLEALKEFFDNVPQDIPHSFVIIQHLSPDYKSLMTELLAKNTRLPIFEVVNGMEIMPGSVYLIPAKKNMTIRDKTLYLVDKPIGHDLNLPIDIFFNSLAEDQGSKAIGVILTGTGSDGTRGLLTIKEAGGMAMVQNPETARFNGMPKSALATGLVDYVLSVDQMPGEILHYISYPKLERSQFDKILMKDEDIVMRILVHLKNFTSLDFTSYKRPTLIRRISRRMTVNNCANANEYLKYLTENASEVQILYKEFLIGVTRFFRDAKAFEVLGKKVIPEILKNAKPKQAIKVWSVGCCTGEEAYSIAILFKEAMERTKKHVEIKIFATDLDKDSIDKAGKGIYEESNVGDINPERLEKFFIKKGNSYQVIQDIRKMIIFSHHNVLQDPPFNKMDLVCTRNLLIYLQPVMQKRMLTTLHYALNLNGYLCLGSSETVADFKKVFEDVDRRWKIYKNKEVARTINFDTFKTNDNINTLIANGSNRGMYSRRSSVENKLADVLNEALTEELGCASVYVDESLNIVHANGNLHSYIKLPEKGFSVNLTKMLPDSMLIAINTSIRKSTRERLESVYKGVRLREENKIRKVVILVKPFQMDRLDTKKYYLIIFFEHSIEELANKRVKDFTTSTKNSALISDLEQELKETKENLQSTIEELETSNEEMQATNEELLAANEELQSTNEELQSVNEELHTVNAEHQLKIQELAQLDADMDNFLKSTEIGTIFLDKNLRIRSFTPAIKEQFNLLPADVGRPISNFTNNLGNIDILEDASQVLKNSIQIEKDVRGGDLWYLMRLLPYKNETGQTEGVVITFVDITNLVYIKKALAESQRSFDSFMEYSPMLTWIKNEKRQYIYTNKSFEEHFKIRRDQLMGKTDSVIYPAEMSGRLKSTLDGLLDKNEVDIAIEHFSKDGQLSVYRTVRFSFIGPEDKRYIGGISQDITQQIKVAEELQMSEARSKAMLKAIPDMMIRTDDTGKILDIETNGVDAGIVANGEMVINQQITDVFPLQVAALHAQALSSALKTNRYIQYEFEAATARDTRDYDVRVVKSNDREVIFIIRDITEYKNSRASIIRAIIEGEEKERTRVAQELHDGLGQILSALKMQIDFSREKHNGNGYENEKSVELIDDAINEYRAISHNLLPPLLEDSNLPQVLITLCNRVTNGEDCNAVFKNDNFKSKPNKILVRELYRIVQELIANAVKHSGCSSIEVKLTENEGAITIKVHDNGKGFDLEESKKRSIGIGLRNLFTRVDLLGGTLEFKSSEAEGTEVTLKVPEDAQKGRFLLLPKKFLPEQLQ